MTNNSHPLLNVLLVDDHPLMRRALANTLTGEPDIRVIGQARNGHEAIEMVRHAAPNVIILDLLMPGLDGVATAQVLTKEWPDIRILALTSSDDDQLFFAALQAGVLGYVTKDAEPGEIVHALRLVGQGYTYVMPSMAVRLTARLQGQPTGAAERLALLKPRELEVLSLVAEGLDTVDIADRLSLAEATVRLYIRNTLDKLQLKNRAQAAVFYLQFHS